MTPGEKQMFGDLYRLLEANADGCGFDQWKNMLDDYQALYNKYRGHPMATIIGAAIFEYCEKRWEHLHGKEAFR